MKKCLYIDHYFHQKTKSTNFLAEKLKETYELDYAFIAEHGDKNIKLDNQGSKALYDLVICFQLLPCRESLDNVASFKEGVIIPMYDGMLPFEDELWSKYRDFKVLNFSRTLHQEFKREGFNSTWIQYCPGRQEIASFGKETSAFFWQRTDNLTVKSILQLLKNSQLQELHVHKAVDPEQKEVKIPKSASVKITTSEWFENKEELKKLIQQSAVYFAPRIYEGIGQSFLEAMAMGRCVVAPDTPTANEYIQNGETGILYNHKKIKELDFSKVREIQKKCLLSVEAMHNNYKCRIDDVVSWMGEKKKNTLTIVVDGTILLNYLHPGAARTGIFFVALNLCKELSKIPFINLAFYVDSSRVELLKKNLESIFGHVIFEIYTEYSSFSKCQAFLSPVFKIPEHIKSNKNILKYTILHDCIPLIFRDGYGENQPWWFEMYDQISNKEHYFANSEYTKGDFLKYKKSLLPSDITVIPLGVSELFRRETTNDTKQIEDVKKIYGIPEGVKYVISVCSLEPRKNLQLAILAFVEFIEQYDLHDLYFVLVGHKWDNFSIDIPEKYRERVICTGYVEDSDIPLLYKGSLFSIFTSKFEGFGLPVLESMALGVPVVTANNTSLPEIAEDSGVYVDSNSKEDHIEAYRKLYFNDDLRFSLGNRGKVLSEKWGWDKAARVVSEKIMQDEISLYPKITIVTVTFDLIKNNRRDKFLRSVNSVFKQTYPGEIEHIIIDGGSTDGTLELIKELKLEGKISKYISEPDKGVYDAMNKGINLASGEYIGFLNSDDYYHDKEGLYWTIRQLILSRADYSYGDALVRDLVTDKKSIWRGDITNIPYASHYCHQTMFVKTSVLKKLNGFDLGYRISSDSDLCMRIAKGGYLSVHNPYLFVTYFIGEGLSSLQAEQSRKDHAHAFFLHYGDKGITEEDCLKLWQCKGFHEFTRADVMRIRMGLKGTIFSDKFKSLTTRKKSALSRFWRKIKGWMR